MFTSLDDLYFAPLTEAPAGGPQKFQTALIEYFGARGTGNEDTPAVIAFFNGRADLYAADVNFNTVAKKSLSAVHYNYYSRFD